MVLRAMVSGLLWLFPGHLMEGLQLGNCLVGTDLSGSAPCHDAGGAFSAGGGVRILGGGGALWQLDAGQLRGSVEDPCNGPIHSCAGIAGIIAGDMQGTMVTAQDQRRDLRREIENAGEGRAGLVGSDAGECRILR